MLAKIAAVALDIQRMKSTWKEIGVGKPPELAGTAVRLGASLCKLYRI